MFTPGKDISKTTENVPKLVNVKFYDGTPIEKALEIIETVCGQSTFSIDSGVITISLPLGTDEKKVFRNFIIWTVVEFAETEGIGYPAGVTYSKQQLDYAPGFLLIEFHKTVTTLSRDAVISAINGRILGLENGRYVIVQVEMGKEDRLIEKLEKYKKRGTVIYASKKYLEQPST